ncbi:NAD(P)-dependent oxidoreductase [Hydrogenophaga sp.]|uniref:NAD(P)-dependent oxidoreductase n=1 Tax=Hydrogenophaga sp. TaxID=1904254 RepID=UPI0027198674|nr:NAD(P)-dependent oxidoreductase [Hydrogenophaga sp.]MDO9437250.1 NAD(P)-dependent oxidoreductase [Hydrogenophaga sp.]
MNTNTNSSARKDTVGFVGLGMMGAPMAANVAKTYPTVVYDIDAAKNQLLADQGAQVATGAVDVGARASTMISMVDTTAQAEDVIIGGFLQHAQAGDLIISMGTIDPLAVRRMHAQLAEKGVDFIDAPVSGMGDAPARADLKTFVGGDAATVERAMPVLRTMASNITHVGDIGQGIVMKLVNNMMVQANRIIVVEALVMGAKAGLDPQMMYDVITKASGNSAAFQHAAPRALKRDFKGIRMDITFKDLELETQLAKALQVPCFMANVAQQVYQMGRASGFGSEDTSAIVKVYEQFAGVTLEARG